jgi:hypothetical protein
MKKMVCEMCGGSDLVKQEGVFVCQSCGSKYSVEDAKRMMIEGTVDVTGSTVKVDNTAKLENLLKIARRAKDDGNFGKAAQHFEAITLEDPNSWEAAFYTAYCSAIQSYKSDKTGSAITTLQNCIDSVFSLIKDHVQGEGAQRKAVAEVVANTHECCEIFHTDTEKEKDSTDREIRNAQKRGVDISTLSSVQTEMYNIRGAKNVAIGKIYTAVGYNVLDMYGDSDELGKSAISGIDKACSLVSYSTANYLKDRESRAIVQKIKSETESIKEIAAKRRFDNYWDLHKDEKASLVSEKSSLNDQITKFNNDIKAVPGYTELANARQGLETEKDNAMSSVARPKTGFLTFMKTISILGIFAGLIAALVQWGTYADAGEAMPGIVAAVIALVLSIVFGKASSKKKKAYRSQQADVEAEFDKRLQSINERNAPVVAAIEAISKNITPLQDRIGDIDTELTKPR